MCWFSITVAAAEPLVQGKMDPWFLVLFLYHQNISVGFDQIRQPFLVLWPQFPKIGTSVLPQEFSNFFKVGGVGRCFSADLGCDQWLSVFLLSFCNPQTNLYMPTSDPLHLQGIFLPTTAACQIFSFCGTRQILKGLQATFFS